MIETMQEVVNNDTGKKMSKGISGSTLKLIAMASMLLDHIGASLIFKIITAGSENFSDGGGVKATPIVLLYYMLRLIGRIAFPLYIYLLVQGFRYTHSRWRYLGRLSMFALISEIPFDMAFFLEKNQIMSGTFVEFEHQNVFFTLAIGMFVLIMVDKCRCMRTAHGKALLYWAIELVIVLLGMSMAHLLKTDYDMIGVLAIYVAYFIEKGNLPNDKKRQEQIIDICITLCLANLSELAALVDIIFVRSYNGSRGVNIKLLFYWFYPVHLLILGIISCLIL